MKSIPRKSVWWSLVAATIAGLAPACDGGDSSGPGGTGGSGGAGASTTSTETGGGGTGGGGTGGTGGDTGGTGGGVTGLPDGAPCATNEECEHGFCLTQAEFGFPYGYCTGACNSFIDCDEGSSCFEVLNNPFCFKNCTADGDCGQGKVCSDQGLDSKVCVPNCTMDAECEGYGTCNETTGDCTPAEDCTLPGDENENALTNCEDGQCVATAECAPVIAEACGAAVPLGGAVGVPVVTQGSTADGTSTFGDWCGGGGNKEKIYKVDVPAGENGLLEAILSSDADMVVYVRKECGSLGDSGCADQEHGSFTEETLYRNVSGGSSYFVFVDGSSVQGQNNEGPFTLRTTLLVPQAETEPNGDVATANAAILPAVSALVTGSLDQVNDDDDWFAIDTSMLAGDKVLEARTIGHGGATCAPNGGGDIDTYLELLAEDGTTVLDSNEDISLSSSWCSEVEATLVPGKYYLHVKTSSLCVPDPGGPDCVFDYGLRIDVKDP